MLTIYGADLSTPVTIVRFTANALGLEYKYEVLNMRGGEHKQPEHMRRHPAGKVPAIDDDGFTLFESGAIMRYLADKADSPLYPRDPRRRAFVDQWLDFAGYHVRNAVGRLLFNRVFAPAMKLPVDEQSLKDGSKFLDQFLPVVETQLGKNKYFAGEEFSLADIALLGALDPAEVCGVDLAPYPSIVKWRDELRSRDFYTICYKNYGEALAAARS
ncbi:MAG: glutathione S-transferase family protein [Elusimicrobiota bacterium]